MWPESVQREEIEYVDYHDATNYYSKLNQLLSTHFANGDNLTHFDHCKTYYILENGTGCIFYSGCIYLDGNLSIPYFVKECAILILSYIWS